MEKIFEIFIGIIFAIVMGSIIFGDNTCSRPPKKDNPILSKECSRCAGTGFSYSVEKRVPNVFSYYHNEKCNTCNGKGYIKVDIQDILDDVEKPTSSEKKSRTSKNTISESSTGNYYNGNNYYNSNDYYNGGGYYNNNDYNSGNSGGNPRKIEYYYEDCHLCHGSGKCITCNGTHRMNYQFGSGTLECPNCGYNGACSSCNGRGQIEKMRAN